MDPHYSLFLAEEEDLYMGIGLRETHLFVKSRRYGFTFAKNGKKVVALKGFARFIVKQLYKHQKDCYYCRRFLTLDNSGHKATLDHKVPLSKGGTWKRTNLVLACHACNQNKGDSDEDVFIARRLKRHKTTRI